MQQHHQAWLRIVGVLCTGRAWRVGATYSQWCSTRKRICIVDTSVHIWTLCAVTTSTAIIAEILKTSRDKTVSKHHAQTLPPYPSSPSDPVPSTSHPSLCHESHRLPFLHHHDSLPPLRLSPQLSRRPCPHFSRRGTLSASMGVPPIRCPPGRAPFSSPRAFSMAGR